MKSDSPLDSAVFQLSPKHSHCELFATSDGKAEKLFSGLLKPFLSHMMIAEELVSQGHESIKLEVKREKSEAWFTKGTVERFVHFVKTPEVLGLVATLDAEMLQLESARGLYSQGKGSVVSDSLGEGAVVGSTATDMTKKALLKAIDVRLLAVKEDLSAACSQAAAAGYTMDNVSGLLLFADHFKASHLKDACSKYLSVCRRRMELINQQGDKKDDRTVRSSSDSDMSIDDFSNNSYSESISLHGTYQPPQEQQKNTMLLPDPPNVAVHEHGSPAALGLRRSSSSAAILHKAIRDNDWTNKHKTENAEPSPEPGEQPVRRLSVQDRINLFENKQREQHGGGGKVVRRFVDLRRLSSDIGSAPAAAAEKAVLRRWSGASDMSIDPSVEQEKDNPTDSSTVTSSHSFHEVQYEDCPTQISNSSLGHTDVSYPFGPVVATTERNQVVSSSVPLRDSSTNGDSSAETPSLRDHGVGPLSKDPEKKAEKNNTSGYVTCRMQDISSNHEVSHAPISRFSQCKTGNSELPLSTSTKEATRGPFCGDNDSMSNDQPALGVELKSSQRHISSSVSFNSSNKSDENNKKNLFVSKDAQEVKTGNTKDYGKSSIVGPWPKQEALPMKSYGVGKNGVLLSETKISSAMCNEVRNSDKVKSARQSSANNQSKTPVDKDDPVQSVVGDGYFASHVNDSVNTNKMNGFTSTALPAYLQSSRQSKGNQELNSELQVKANELEKLFAAHKQRVAGEQSALSVKSKDAIATRVIASGSEDAVDLPETSPRESFGSSKTGELNCFSRTRNRDYSCISNQRSDAVFLEEARGVLYDKYMQKRDTKLKEEWVSKKDHREAKMKVMHDILERSRAELKAKLDLCGKNSYAHRRVNKLRPFKVQASSRNNVQADENVLVPEKEKRSSSFGFSSQYDSSVKATNSKKHLDSTSLSSTASHISGPGASHLTKNGLFMTSSLAQSGTTQGNVYIDDEKVGKLEVVMHGAQMGNVQDTERPRKSDESEKLDDFSSSKEHVQESPVGSPTSWVHHSFAYNHETSDVDASVDSPVGSPASWNSHSLPQAEAETDVSRTRMKWGNMQKPILATVPSQQSRKDVAKGLKRLLKFGRKTRGPESLVNDWVSASTASEGDDDADDGRDFGNLSAEDPRKSRMGSLLGPSGDSFREGECLNDQMQPFNSSIPVPSANFKLREENLPGSALKGSKSFFLLSSFRSKAGEQKLR